MAPDALPDLWPQKDGDPTALATTRLAEYFAGGYQARIPAEDYEEFMDIPGCSEAVLAQAVGEAVEQGIVWLVNGPASVWYEPVPEGVLSSAAELHPPPNPVAAQELTAESLPGAWTDGKTNAAELARALSIKRGYTVPGPLMTQAIKDSVRSRWLSMVKGSSPLDSGWDQAGAVVLERPTISDSGDSIEQGGSGGLFSPDPSTVALDGPQVQTLADAVPDLLEAAPASDLHFHVRVEATGDLADDERRAVDSLLERVAKGLTVE